MPTVIDSFIVTLGLDPTNFTKGQKEAAKRTLESQDKVKKSTELLTKSVVDAGKALGTLFLGFEGFRGAVGFLGNLNASNAALGRTAGNAGVAVHELDMWGKAAELAGGKAEGMQAAFTALSQGITDFQVNKTVSPMLQLLQRLGVGIYDAEGKVRSKADIFGDLGNQLRKLPREQAHNLAAGYGINDDALNLLLKTRTEYDAILAKANDAANITEKQTKAAEELQGAWRGVKQEIEAGANSVLNMTGALTPALEGLGGMLQSLNRNDQELDKEIERHGGGLVGYFKSRLGIGDDEADANDAAAARVAEATASANAYRRFKNKAPGGDLGLKLQYKNNPGNVKAVGGESFMTYETLAKGIAAASRQLDIYKNRDHVNTIEGIVKKYEGKDAPGNHNNIEAYISDVAKDTGIDRSKPLSDSDRARVLQAMFKHEGSGKIPLETIQAAIGATPGAQGGNTTQIANNGGPSNSVSIGEITVNTAATDADGIAVALGSSLARKNLLGQANVGMVQ